MCLAWHGSNKRMHFDDAGVNFIIRLTWVSSIVSIHSSPRGVGIHVTNVNRHLGSEIFPLVCCNKCCQDYNTDAVVCNNTSFVVSFGKLHMMELLSIYPTMCCINLMIFVRSVN